MPAATASSGDPEPGHGEVRIRVEACAVCRTDLHVIDGELPQ
ncbi:alcohol dehydrogenase, partial [Methylobacterium radiotolerans]